MSRFDDILNVYAYLFSKSKGIAENAKTMADRMEALEDSMDHMDARLDSMMASLEETLSQTRRLAEEMGLDISDICTEPVQTEQIRQQNDPVCTDIRIDLPADFSFQKDFRRLVQEAHAAGFTKVHPEELLTPGEMARAKMAADRLDEEFAAQTRLRRKDIQVLIIAVAIRVASNFLLKKIQMMNQDEALELGETAKSSNTRQKEAQDTAAVQKKEETQGTVTIDASQGVDIDGMLNNMSNYQGAVKAGQRVADNVTRKFGKGIFVLDYSTILNQNAPFDIQKTDLFERQDIVAYNKFLGWIVGVVNILTDTITTYQMKSYSVTRPQYQNGKPCINQEINTVFGVLGPVLRGIATRKDSLIAATLQEAIILEFGKAQPEQIRTIFGRAIELEHRTMAAAEETRGILWNLNEKWAECIGGVAMTTLLNTIISAIHAILYDEEDGSLEMYSIRTNRIILYAGAVATMVNSIPAIVDLNMEDVDFSGILTTCISLFQSSGFWIDVKTEFLISAYREDLEKELCKLDRYFA